MAVAFQKGILRAPTATLFLCDMQEKFRKSIVHFPEILLASKRLVSIEFLSDVRRLMQLKFYKCPLSSLSR